MRFMRIEILRTLQYSWKALTKVTLSQVTIQVKIEIRVWGLGALHRRG